MIARKLEAVPIPRRELVTLFAYLQAGNHRGAAHRLGISVSTSRQRISQLIGRLGVESVGQAIWVLRDELDAEARADARRGATPRVSVEAEAGAEAGD